MQTHDGALVRDQDVIFNLAGQVSHIDSMRDPYTDLEINCRAQLSILEACRKYNRNVRVVFAGTRQVYGRPDYLPVDEKHLVRPADINGVNKAAGEYYHLLYNNVFDVRACSLRLTNVYGPRQLIKHNRQGFIGWFIRLALEGREIQIFGDGSQLRDFVYVDDAADAFLRAGAADACDGDVFNVGGDAPISHRDLAHLLVEHRRHAARCGSSTGRRTRSAIDIGSFYSDSTQVPRRDRLDAAVGARRGPAAHARVLPRAPATRTWSDGATRRSGARDPVPAARRLARIGRRSTAAIARRRSTRGWFILGPELEAFEQEFAAASGAAMPSASATAPMRWRSRCARLGVGAGDEVITSPLSAAYTALAIMMAGARPVFADIDPVRLTLDPDAGGGRRHAANAPRSCRCTSTVRPRTWTAIAAVAHAPRPGHRRRLLPGAPRDLRRPPGRRLRRGRRVQLLSDQEPRRARRRRRVDHQRRAVADARRRLRNGGQSERYRHAEFGVNSRLDEIQAAVLRERLQGLAAATVSGARWPPITARCLKASTRSPCRRSSTPARLPSLSGPSDDREALQTAPARSRHRDAGALPDADSRGSRPGGRPGRLPGSGPGLRRVLSLPLYPGAGCSSYRQVVAAVRSFPWHRVAPRLRARQGDRHRPDRRGAHRCVC